MRFGIEESWDEFPTIDADGSIATATRTVTLDTSGGEDWIELGMFPETGVTPFATKLSAEPHLTNPLVSSSLVAPGAANPPAITQVSTTEYDLVFTSPGTYFLTYEGIDDQGVTHTRDIMVNVQDRDAFDAMLQSQWDGMKAAMIAGDVDGTVSFIAEGNRETFLEIYTRLQAQLPQIAADMQAIELIDVTGNIAEYRITKEVMYQGSLETVTFYVYFQQDWDGIWRVWDY